MQNNLAFVFPGQGSQTVGMLADFADNDVVQQTFTEASDALGYNLWQLVAEGPVEKLNQTFNVRSLEYSVDVEKYTAVTAGLIEVIQIKLEENE